MPTYFQRPENALKRANGQAGLVTFVCESVVIHVMRVCKYVSSIRR